MIGYDFCLLPPDLRIGKYGGRRHLREKKKGKRKRKKERRLDSILTDSHDATRGSCTRGTSK
jgi:hypothetical protein